MSEKQRILLVDDDPNISHLVRLYLEKEGFDVTESARGDEALGLRELHGKLGLDILYHVEDLVLLDYALVVAQRHSPGL